MYGLLGDRLLRRFAAGLRRRRDRAALSLPETKEENADEPDESIRSQDPAEDTTGKEEQNIGIEDTTHLIKRNSIRGSDGTTTGAESS